MRSLHSLIWLHLLRVRDLDRITVESYADDSFAGFATAEHNLRGLWPWEDEVVRSWIDDHDHVLVAGAGGGREMIAMARMGFAVSGFDASPELVAAGHANLAQAAVVGELVGAPAGCVPPGPPVHGALIVGRGVYHHLPRRAARIAFLAACRARLIPGSPILIGDVLIRKSGPRPGRLILRSSVEPGDSIEFAFNHYFTAAELSAELEQAGFMDARIHATPFPGVDHLAHATARS